MTQRGRLVSRGSHSSARARGNEGARTRGTQGRLASPALPTHCSAPPPRPRCAGQPGATRDGRVEGPAIDAEEEERNAGDGQERGRMRVTLGSCHFVVLENRQAGETNFKLWIARPQSGNYLLQGVHT